MVDGCITMDARIAVNGEIVAQGKQFDVSDVEVVAATVDLDEVQSHRGAFQSMSAQAASVKCIPTVRVPGKLCASENVKVTPKRAIRFTHPRRKLRSDRRAGCGIISDARARADTSYRFPGALTLRARPPSSEACVN